MTDTDDTVDNPAGYGIQDPEHPGEPNYWGHDVSEPVPGTAKHTRDRRQNTSPTEGSGHKGGGGRDSH